ncbi:hypothetical protein [Catenulispora subtropica]|uniref:hypothetical protein n=1 Tax=Catenulispora subtropica TaxID=450798 RepID=UPI0031DA3214
MTELPVAPLDAATRTLCAQVYWDTGFAREAEELLRGDGYSAIGPPVGLNLPSILQHTRHSLRIRRRRDWALLACWVLAAFCIAGPLLITRGTKDFPPTVFGVACGVGSVAALAWTIGTAARWLRVYAAFALLRASASPLASAPPLPADVHGEIVADQGSNVVCYSAACATPFDGYGEVVDGKVNVGLPLAMVPVWGEKADKAGKNGGNGKYDEHDRGTAPPARRVDATDLHIFLRNEMSRDSGVQGLQVVSNLFVRGDAANGVNGLWPGGKETRPSRQAHALIYSAGINDPGDRAQTYLTFQAVRHGGMLAVTMHVRIRQQHERMSLEIASAVAAPLAGKYTTAGGSLPRTVRGLRAHARWYALMELPVALTEAWSGPLLRFVTRRLVLRDTVTTRNAIRGGRMPDRGARTSLRCWTMDPAKILYQEEADARDILQRLRKALFDHLVRYFELHGIATDELLRVRDNILVADVSFSRGVTSAG